MPKISRVTPRTGVFPLRPDSLSKMRRGFVAPLTGNIAGFWCVAFRFEISMEKLSDGTEPSRTLKIANVPGTPCSEASFISERGSASRTRVVGL